MNESRVKKSLLNARINIICYFLSLAIAFFTRKIFLDQLGTNFIGLTSTLQSLLNFLNLAELGIGTAIGYVLYKPIYENNHPQINEIISVFGFLYRCIGLTILCAGVILSFFLPLIFSKAPFEWGIIYFGFYAYLAASLLGYFANYKMTLLSADQKNYIITGYFQATTVLKTIIQMLFALYTKNFYLYLSFEIIFGIINSIILNKKIEKTYPWLKSDIKKGRKLFKEYPEISKYVKQLFIHKIAGFVQFQITPFLIYSFVSLPTVALYGNYTLITQRIQGFVNGVLDSTGAGVGNLISEGKQKSIIETYNELLSIRLFISCVLSICIYQLSSSFILLWLGEQYPLANYIVLLISLQLYITTARGATDQFLFGYGLFYDIWAPISESILFIIISITLGTIWGLGGILCGPFFSSLIIVHIWKPYFLYKKGLRLPFSNYWKIYITHIIPIIITYFLLLFTFKKIGLVNSMINSWREWIIFAIIFTITLSIISLILLYLISPHIRSFAHRFFKKYK